MPSFKKIKSKLTLRKSKSTTSNLSDLTKPSKVPLSHTSTNIEKLANGKVNAKTNSKNPKTHTDISSNVKKNSKSHHHHHYQHSDSLNENSDIFYSKLNKLSHHQNNKINDNQTFSISDISMRCAPLPANNTLHSASNESSSDMDEDSLSYASNNNSNSYNYYLNHLNNHNASQHHFHHHHHSFIDVIQEEQVPPVVIQAQDEQTGHLAESITNLKLSNTLASNIAIQPSSSSSSGNRLVPDNDEDEHSFFSCYSLT